MPKMNSCFLVANPKRSIRSWMNPGESGKRRPMLFFCSPDRDTASQRFAEQQRKKLVALVQKMFRAVAVLGGVFLTFSSAHGANPVLVRIALSEAPTPAALVGDRQAIPMLTDLLQALFHYTPGYRPAFHAFPWTRAQQLVATGRMDLFVTSPSASRAEYANFSHGTLYTSNYGNLVYDLKGGKGAQIESAKSFEDLKNLIFVSQQAIEWEVESVPTYIERYMVNASASLMHMTFHRHMGDFFIMPAEQAIHYAKQLGYEGQLGMKKVSFIPNSLVHFRVGIRKTYPGHKELMAELEAGLSNPKFLAEKRAIELKYHGRHAID